MAQDSIFGQIKISTRDSFSTANDKETVYGKAQMDNLSKVSIKEINETAMEFIHGQMGIYMKDSSNMI